jgi:hypothetical protein
MNSFITLCLVYKHCGLANPSKPLLLLQSQIHQKARPHLKGPSHYGSEANNMPTWPQHIPLLPWHYWPFVNSWYWQVRPVFPSQHTSMLYWVYPPPRPVLRCLIC